MEQQLKQRGLDEGHLRRPAMRRNVVGLNGEQAEAESGRCGTLDYLSDADFELAEQFGVHSCDEQEKSTKR